MNLLTNPNSNRMNSALTVISHRRSQMMRPLIVINQPINQMSNPLRRRISQNSKQKTRPLRAINRPSKQKNSPLTVISRRRPEARTTRWRLPEEIRHGAEAGEPDGEDEARPARFK